MRGIPVNTPALGSVRAGLSYNAGSIAALNPALETAVCYG